MSTNGKTLNFRAAKLKGFTVLVWGCVSFKPVGEKVDKLIQTFPKPQVT